ncbi:DUF4249 domain-containing protein [Marivirga salinae]|uniref:DUF4249 domain-containing protein n=1 Tax=Marivirga salinarum TaxID=3059078 RepID=A0AA49J8N1_9BACT|nr:DUF4249 domain-containing protein [Marivirga sp. BDSF4-3]WKK75759.1 DUF4249 domain-containing protein [Marivirga sp. BDSF4-3]
MKNNLKFIILSLILFSGCQKEVDLKIDESESKLVLNAWFKTEQHPVVEVNRSTFIFDKRGTDNIQNAEVILFENDKEIGFLEHFGSGFYQNENIEIKPDTEYKIIAKVDGFEDVVAIEKSLETFKEGDLQFEYTSEEVNHQYGNGSESEITLTFKDNPSSEDFYLFMLKRNAKEWSIDNPEDTTYIKYDAYLESSDLQIEFVYLNSMGQMQVLKDELFNGNEYTIRFTTNNLSDAFYGGEDYEASSEYVFEIHKISKSFYLYLKSLELNQYPDPFTEPTQIFTNVENGYGILATSTVVEIPIEIKDANK